MEERIDGVVYHNRLTPFDASVITLSKRHYNPNHAMWLVYAANLGTQ